MGWEHTCTPWPLCPRKMPGTHFIEGWLGPKAGLDGCRKSHPHRDSTPGPSSPYRVAIPTALSRPITTGRVASNEKLSATSTRSCDLSCLAGFCDKRNDFAESKVSVPQRTNITLSVCVLIGIGACAC